MPKLNNTFLILIGLVVVVLLFIAAYDMFLKPPDESVDTYVQSINPYFGDDVLSFIGK